MLLGFLDEAVTTENAAGVTYSTSKVGGKMHLKDMDTSNLHQSCRICSSHMRLVCQIYCPVDEKHDRIICILCCTNGVCQRKSTGWMALRIMIPLAKANTAHDTKLLTTNAASLVDDWGVNQDWDDTDTGWELTTGTEAKGPECILNNSTSDLDITCSLLEQFSILGIKEDGAATHHGYFDEYFIYVLDEDDRLNDKLDSITQRLVDTYKYDEDASESSSRKRCASTAKSEQYDSTDVAHGDKVFYKFIKAVSRHPQQIIRYDIGGKPLPMVKLEMEHIPNCSKCGVKRSFELQLMPALLQSLTVEGNLHRVDAGTVLIFTCNNNCSDFKVSEECIAVQQDPDEYLMSKLTPPGGENC